MKTILGLDLGTNSIGWALIDKENKKILGMGSRIIPMGAEKSTFEQGQAQTKNAKRRLARGARKLNKRYKQRRNKLIYILQQLGMLPDQIQLVDPFTDPTKIDRICIKPIQQNQRQLTAFDLVELRVRALTEKIELKDLGKILYRLNQLRGYSGGNAELEKEDNEDDENAIEKRNENYVAVAKILSLGEPERVLIKGKGFNKRKAVIEIEEGQIEGETFLDVLKADETYELLISIRKSKKGDTVTFKLPNKTSWRKKMENLEKSIQEKSKELNREYFISEFLLDVLKENKWAKIRNNVILRSRYEAEFDAIWNEQSKHYPILDSCEPELLKAITSFIFPGNSTNQQKFRNEGNEKGLKHVIKEQIIFFQRELKDQSHLIGNCRFEPGKKVIAKSHPVFQEYKIWEQINKLIINTKTENGVNKKGDIKYSYIDRPIPVKLKEWLFDELQVKKEISFKTIYDKLKSEYNLRDGIDFLNGLDAKTKLKGNETKIQLKKVLGVLWDKLGMDQIVNQIKLWNALYNGKGNEYDINSERTSKILSILKESGTDIENIEQLAIQISKIKFSRNYASLSLEAIEKILPLVRAGKYFEDNLSYEVKEKIIKLVNENVDDPFEKSAQEFLEKNVEMLVDGGIMNAYAVILIYGRHTAKEFKGDELINQPSGIKMLKQGELRNPLVEQLINEALVVIKDIWCQFGEKPTEIKVELARDLKNNAKERQQMHKANLNNHTANNLVKERLIELKEELTLANMEKYKLWMSQENLKEEYVKQYSDPSKSEVEKMRLWETQGHVSPYTGQPIPLSELFNRERYDVDHIIPISRYFDDSMANKVICEKSVNKDKGNRTAMEYFEIGSITQTILSKTDFIEHANKNFYGRKRKNLLATSVPEDPVTRQIKETQYIALRVKEELNKIVGNENVKSSTGRVTDYLRNYWGLTDKFKNILKPRYENSMDNIANEEYKDYQKKIEKKQKEYAEKGIPFEEIILDNDVYIEKFKKDYIQLKRNKLVIQNWSKRIDHRHHAIDALVVSCTEPAHIKRLNDLNKVLQDWVDKHREEYLPGFKGSASELLDEILALDENKRKEIFRELEKFSAIELPWKGFPEDAAKKIEEIVVSHKPKDKLLIQKDKNGDYQMKMRGQLHEGTVYGKSKGKESYRISLTKLAGKTFATEKTIEKITNEFLKLVIRDHLNKSFGGKKEEAFSAEGIFELNKYLSERKDGNGNPKPHPPISSINIFYKDPQKTRKKNNVEEEDFSLQKLDRQKAFNNSLFVKTGDNYLFAVLEKEEVDKKTKELKAKRIFDIITFFDAASLLKEAFNNTKNKSEFDKKGVFKSYFEEKNKAKFLFALKQNDVVYLPNEAEEMITDTGSPLYNAYWKNKKERAKNIYVVQKFSGNEIYFLHHNISDTIRKKIEFGSQDCYQNFEGRSIKENCWKLETDRLGNIIKIAQ